MIKEFIEKYNLKGTILGNGFAYICSLHQKRRRVKIDNKMHKAMEMYGIEALKKIYDVFSKHNTNIWFEYGTLLGAYREKGFIPYDYDIDLGMYAEQFSPELQRALFDDGFLIKRIFYKIDNMKPSNRTMTEFSLIYKTLQIDVFLYFREGENRVGYVYTDHIGEAFMARNMYSVRKTVLENSTIKEIDFLGIKFGMPSNTANCLEKLYGKTFMTPIKDYSYTKKNECLPYKKSYGEMLGIW